MFLIKKWGNNDKQNDEVYFTESSTLADASATTKYNPFPIGYVYISTSATNPGTIFGGTWTQLTDTYLVAAGSTYTAGDTGGTATNTITGTVRPHKLVINELPSHSHRIPGYGYSELGTARQYLFFNRLF